eukprot:tig00000786_g4060.t1
MPPPASPAGLQRSPVAGQDPGSPSASGLRARTMKATSALLVDLPAEAGEIDSGRKRGTPSPPASLDGLRSPSAAAALAGVDPDDMMAMAVAEARFAAESALREREKAAGTLASLRAARAALSSDLDLLVADGAREKERAEAAMREIRELRSRVSAAKKETESIVAACRHEEKSIAELRGSIRSAEEAYAHASAAADEKRSELAAIEADLAAEQARRGAAAERLRRAQEARGQAAAEYGALLEAQAELREKTAALLREMDELGAPPPPQQHAAGWAWKRVREAGKEAAALDSLATDEERRYASLAQTQLTVAADLERERERAARRAAEAAARVSADAASARSPSLSGRPSTYLARLTAAAGDGCSAKGAASPPRSPSGSSSPGGRRVSGGAGAGAGAGKQLPSPGPATVFGGGSTSGTDSPKR